jgi:septal ring factor EnvC (AmiA/AmiB activator)
MHSIKKPDKKHRYWLVLTILFVVALPATGLDTAQEYGSTLEAIRDLSVEQERRVVEIEALEQRAAIMAGRTAELRSALRVQEEAVAEIERQVLDVQFQASKLRDALTTMQDRGKNLIRMRFIRDRHQRSFLRNAADEQFAAEEAMPALQRHLTRLDHRIIGAQEILLDELRQAHSAQVRAEEALESLRSIRVERRRLAQESLRSLQREEGVLSATMAAIQEQVSRGQLELDRLQHNARTLEEALTKMQQSSAVPAALTYEPFAARRGRLEPPLPTARLHRFDEPRTTSAGPVRWQGEVFAITGTLDVRAVHPGEIVFADWMRGYGFLAIVDHGDGFMTLYGHNHELLAQVGDRVEAGQTIALVARDTPAPGPGLYFELRQDAKVLNPAAWWKSNGN